MPPERVTWIVVAVALLQVLLGGAVLVTREAPASSSGQLREAEDEATSAPDPAQGPAAVAGSPQSADVPTAQASQPAADAPDATTPRPSGKPAPAPLKLHGTYEQLKPEEQRMVTSDPPYESAVEGRLVDGSFWRLSAYKQPTGGICFESNQWDPRTRSGGGGGAGQTDCKGSSQWNWGMTASGDRYVGLVGYAPVDAHEIELVTKDGGKGRVGGVFKTAMGVSFFVAWLECGGRDLDRVDALDRNGKVLSTLSLKEFPQGMPSWFCDFLKEGP